MEPPWPCAHPEELPSVEKAVCILQQSRKQSTLSHAVSHHTYLCSLGLESHPHIGNFLVPLFVEYGNLDLAHQTFHRVIQPNEFGWTSLIQGYVDKGEPQTAVKLFQHMQKGVVFCDDDVVDGDDDSDDFVVVDGDDMVICPSAHTFVAILKACAKLKCIDLGKRTHADIITRGIEENVFVGSTLVDMYVKCGSLVEAQRVFDKLLSRNIVSWNALISGYSEYGYVNDIRICFDKMRLDHIVPNAVSYVNFLKACASIEALEDGMDLHAEIVKAGYDDNPYVENVLVDLYAKCAHLAEAYALFSKISKHDNVVLWTALIAGYARCGLIDEALHLFEEMQIEGVSPDIISWNSIILVHIEQECYDKAVSFFGQMLEQGLVPNDVTLMTMVQACGSMMNIEMGKRMHSQVFSYIGISMELDLNNVLIDMYTRYGKMRDAHDLFDTMPIKDLVTWNCMIAGYARLGESDWVFNLFNLLRVQGMHPDEITFLNVFNTCSHLGLIDKARYYWKVMTIEYGLNPTIAHHNCIVDMLVRAGNLNRAMQLLEDIPCQADLLSWSSILRACQTWKNVELGKYAFDEAVNLDANYDGAFAIMSNIYAQDGMWEDAKGLQTFQELRTCG